MNPRSLAVVALLAVLAALCISDTTHAQGAPPTEDYFVEAQVDDDTPYVGQQVTYTFRFYAAYWMEGKPEYQPPRLLGIQGQGPAVQKGVFDHCSRP